MCRRPFFLCVILIRSLNHAANGKGHLMVPLIVLHSPLFQHLPKQFIYHSRICLSFHGLHDLTDQCPESLFFSTPEVFHSLRIVRNDLLCQFAKGTFIIDRLESVLFHIFFRINILRKYFFKHFLRHRTVDRSGIRKLNQLRQILR